MWLGLIGTIAVHERDASGGLGHGGRREKGTVEFLSFSSWRRGCILNQPSNLYLCLYK